MQINLTTDYAIRSLLYITIQNKPVASSAIAEAMSIPPTYLISVMTKLKKAGLVSALRGNCGGYFLIRKPADISLLDIIEAMEETMRINRCLEEDEYCNRFATESCPVRDVYAAVQTYIENSFSKVTLQSLREALRAKGGNC